MEHYDKLMDVDLRGVLSARSTGSARCSRRATAARSSTGRRSAASTPRPSRACTRPPRPASSRSPRPPPSSTARKGIRANCICPGFIHTEMSAGGENIPGMLEKAALDRGGQPEEVAEVAAFLASDRASFVSRRRHPGRRRVGREARVSPPGTVSTGEARAVRVPRAWHPSPRRCSSSPSSATARRCWPAGRASSRCSRCGSPSSSTSSTSGASPSCRASSAATATLWVGAGTTQAARRGQRRGRVDGAAARQGDAVHRPLPDPQPRHARRIDRPRRSGRRVPGGRVGARRAHGGRLGARPPHHRRARLLRRAVEHQHRSPTSSSSACRSRSGAGGAASRSRSSRAATATSRSRVRRSASSSTTTTGSGAARSA